MLIATGRCSNLCSCSEGKPWHESGAIMHWWLVRDADIL